jgi:hypothetical protein
MYMWMDERAPSSSVRMGEAPASGKRQSVEAGVGGGGEAGAGVAVGTGCVAGRGAVGVLVRVIAVGETGGGGAGVPGASAGRQALAISARIRAAASQRKIEDAFGMRERGAVDIAVRFLRSRPAHLLARRLWMDAFRWRNPGWWITAPGTSGRRR